MLSRVNFEDWQAIITVIAFALCFITFIFFSVKAFRMKKSERDHMSQLPLEDSEPNSKKSS